MEVLIWKESQFHKLHADLRRAGGVASKAAEAADGILWRLTKGAGRPEEFGRLTKNGESRIPDCAKYDLPGGYRLVTVQNGQAAQVLFVGTHDDCDRWIDRHTGLRVVFDPKTKRLTTIREVTVDAGLPQREYRPVYDPTERLIEKIDEDHIDLLPIRPADLRRIAALTVVSTDDEIMDAVEHLSDRALQDAMLGMLAELRDGRVEAAHAQIKKYVGAVTPIDDTAGALQNALKSGTNSDLVVNLRDLSEDEVRHLFGQSQFQDWLLFLHPDQKPVVEADYGGAAQLRGVSGSGKTCVVVHRARHLAVQYPDERIAVLTLNPALAALIDDLLTTLCTDNVRTRIEVLDISELCRRIVAHYDAEKEVDTTINPEALETNWTETFRNPGVLEYLRPIITSLATTRSIDAVRYIRDEFIWVRSAFAREAGAESGSVLPARDKYRDPELSPRRGREIPFIRDWRDRILKALEVYEEQSERRNLYDPAALTLLAHRYLRNVQHDRPAHLTFRSVLVDEVQDLGNVELEIVRSVATTIENGLFLSGDLRQQVFPKDHDVARAGIPVVVRKAFRKNYRNSRQILEAGVALMKQFGPNNQLGEDIGVLDPEYSARDSARPLVVSAPDPDHETRFIAGYVRLKRTLDDHPVCIVACGLREDDSASLTALRGRLSRAGLITTTLHRDSLVRAGSVFLSALETVKGFEFSLVIICQCSQEQMPVPTLPEEESWRDASRLYVAFTRARDELVITHAGAPSRFLKGIEQTLRWSTTDEQGLVPDNSTEELEGTDQPNTPLPAVDASENGPRQDALPEPKNDEILAELARLKAENQRLKAAGKATNRIRVSEKGGVSVYGLSRFPVTLYKQQWKTLLEMEDEIRAFIRANEDKLASKTTSGR
jgi:superfamily I DNA/RNA helicase